MSKGHKHKSHTGMRSDAFEVLSACFEELEAFMATSDKPSSVLG